MTWSYNIASGLAKDTVRLYIGDIDVDAPQLQDEEIAVYVAASPDNPMMAAASACLALAARYSRNVNRNLGQSSVSSGDRMKAYLELANVLTAQAAAAAVVGLDPMEVGGITVAEHRNVASQTGLVQPTYSRGMHDFPGNGDSGGNRGGG